MSEITKHKPNPQWHSWLDPYRVFGGPSPYGHPLVWVDCDGWEKPQVLNPHKLHPMTNIAGWRWRPYDGVTIDAEPIDGGRDEGRDSRWR